MGLKNGQKKPPPDIARKSLRDQELR
jgi:hypothetical protein